MSRLLFSRVRLLQSLSWKGLGAFMLFVTALSAWTWSGVLLIEKTLSYSEHVDYATSLLQRNLLMYFPIYLMVAIADSLPLRGTWRRVALVAGLIAGGLLAVQARCAAMPDSIVYVYGSITMPYCQAFPTWHTYFDMPATFITPMANAAVIMIFILSRRRDAELVAALHGARSTQVEARRQRIESEIEAMRSRIDPDGLLATLRDIRARYERDAAAGERELDDLIQGLRDAASRAGAQAGTTPA